MPVVLRKKGSTDIVKESNFLRDIAHLCKLIEDGKVKGIHFDEDLYNKAGLLITTTYSEVEAVFKSELWLGNEYFHFFDGEPLSLNYMHDSKERFGTYFWDSHYCVPDLIFEEDGTPTAHFLRFIENNSSSLISNNR